MAFEGNVVDTAVVRLVGNWQTNQLPYMRHLFSGMLFLKHLHMHNLVSSHFCQSFKCD